MSEQFSKHDHVLLSLVMNLQTMTMVQLGKVASPHTGELERDLDGARGTIDLLEMLKAKCRHETPAPLLQVLDQAVMELQMNYLDERKRDHKAPAAEPAADESPADEDATP
jgi:hypothetical protein